MYSDKITLFNRYKSSAGNMWYPTVIDAVNLLVDRSAIVAKYGAESKDHAVLNIHYQTVNGKIIVDGKPYLQQKEWHNQTNEKMAETITFTPGEIFDFFMTGEYPELPVSDDDYRDGFYNYMNSQFDGVYAITSVAKLNLIPHFEITGK